MTTNAHHAYGTALGHLSTNSFIHLHRFHQIPPCPLRSSRLRLLCTILAPGRDPVSHTTQIHGPSHQMVSHTGTILTPASANQHDTVLLHVMTLSWNIRCDDSASTETYTCGFALGRIRLLGLCDTNLEADTLQLCGVNGRECRGNGVAGTLRFAAPLCILVAGCRMLAWGTYAHDLHEGGLWSRCAGELSH